MLRDPAVASGIGQFGAVQIVAPALGVQLTPVDVRDPGEIERAVAAFARGSNGGLIVTGCALGIVHRELIITVAARHKLPAVFPGRFFVTGGGLISYGPDIVDQFRAVCSDQDPGTTNWLDAAPDPTIACTDIQSGTLCILPNHDVL